MKAWTKWGIRNAILGLPLLLAACSGGEDPLTDESAAGTAGTAGERGTLTASSGDGCPASAAPQADCAAPDLACTYAGGMFGLSTIAGPLTCFCAAQQGADHEWVCVETDDSGHTDCPLYNDLSDVACETGETCVYAWPITTAHCRCAGESFLCAL